MFTDNEALNVSANAKNKLGLHKIRQYAGLHLLES